MRRPHLVLLTAPLALVLASGCTGRIIKEGLGVVTGANGSFLPIQPIADKGVRPLGEYKCFEIGQIVDDIGGKAPPDFLGYLPAELDKQLRGKKLPNQPGGKTLIFRGRIIHYETSGTLGVALGPLEEVIVRTELVDKDTGKVLGVANCIGRTDQSVNMGVQKKAEGLAEAFAKWVDAHYPKTDRGN